ncbi:MAG: MaoC family dehydratase [Panacagrimonas sp.]
MSLLYFEDFHAGQTIELGSHTFTQGEIIDFARQFDPQPFHLDEEAGRKSHFGGLVASGWHTCSTLMRLLVDGLLLNTSGLGSPGVDKIRWIKPVRPGDSLRGTLNVLETIPSTSKPDRGVVRSEYFGTNQHGEVVVTMNTIAMYGRRPAK